MTNSLHFLRNILALMAPLLMSAQTGTGPTTGQDQCPMAVVTQHNDCAYPPTGCFCIFSGVATPQSLPDCGGCKLDVMGTQTCNWANQPFATTSSASCNMNVPCGSADMCDILCPCDDAIWFRFIVACGTCPQDH